MKIIYLALAMMMATAIGCGKKDDAQNNGKDLFSVWTVSNTTTKLDFTGLRYGIQPYGLFLSAGGSCDCTIDIEGSQSSGTMDLESCAFNARGTSNIDPGCAANDGKANYTKTTDTLKTCDVVTNQCTTFN